MLTELQKAILEYVKREYFHVTLKDFISCTGVQEEDALNALKDLKSKRIVTTSPNIMGSFIGVTNYGWKLMGWKK